MANTPEVGPSPTTRTKISAQISSGTLLSSISSQRTAWRTDAGKNAMRPTNADTDKVREAINASGTAHPRASVMPAVAMATVRQVSRATIHKNSGSSLGGKKSPKKCKVGCRLCGLNSVQGLNSASTSSGQATASVAHSANTRPIQAGSRRGAALKDMVRFLPACGHQPRRGCRNQLDHGCGACQLVKMAGVQIGQPRGGHLVCRQIKNNLAFAQPHDPGKVLQSHFHVVQCCDQRGLVLTRYCGK